MVDLAPTLGVGCWAGVGAHGGWCGCLPLLLWYTTLLCSAVLCATCCRVLASFIVCLCRLWRAALRCAPRCLREVWRPRLPGQGRSPRRGRVWVTSEAPPAYGALWEEEGFRKRPTESAQQPLPPANPPPPSPRGNLIMPLWWPHTVNPARAF